LEVSTSNIENPERFQSKALPMIMDATWYVPNTVARRDLQTPTVKEEIRRYSSQYSARLIVEDVQRWIVFTPLSVNDFVTLATQ
jgi:hypothetical protein